MAEVATVMSSRDPDDRRREYDESERQRIVREERARRELPERIGATPVELQRQVDRLGGQLDTLREFLEAQFDAVKDTINGKIREQDLKIKLAEERVGAVIKEKEQLNSITRKLVFGAACLLLAAILTAFVAGVIVQRGPGEPVNLRPPIERNR